MKNTLKYLIGFLMLTLMGVSCNSSYLDVIPNKKVVVPQTLKDVRALLNNTRMFNGRYPGVPEVLADDYYMPDNSYDIVATMSTGYAYRWDRDAYHLEINDWSICYTTIFYVNVALETLDNMSGVDRENPEWNELRGKALFFRSLSTYGLMQLFAKPYQKSTADRDLGVVLKLTSDFNEPVTRATVQECYDKMIVDLNEADKLAPEMQEYKTMPTKGAVNALLARLYLTMGEYDKALNHAIVALNYSEGLMDYNDLDTNALVPFPIYNKEVIFHASLFEEPTSLTRITRDLYDLYADNDLRKYLYFTELEGSDIIDFKGGYVGNRQLFWGFASNELYLIIAECYARIQENQNSLNYLNELLEKRMDNSSPYIPIANLSNQDLLNKIFEERRKELVFRGLRWSDLRRYSFERSFKIIRVIKGEEKELKSDEISSFVMKIPHQVIINNNLIQNE